MASEEPHPFVAIGPRSLPSPVGEARITGAVGPRTLETMMAIAEAVFSDANGPPPADRMAYLREEYADFMARASVRGRFTFTAGAALVSWVAPLLVLRVPPFRRLSLSARVRALQKLEKRPLGSVLIALRAILCVIYYEHPEAAKEIGFTWR